MTVEIKYKDTCEIILCEGGFFTGNASIIGMTQGRKYNFCISNKDASREIVFYLGGGKEHRIKRQYPDSLELSMTWYSSDDPSIAEIMQPFQGMKMAEISTADIAVTVTV